MIEYPTRIRINKNRGWRGLAEAMIINDKGEHESMIFSFSPQTWDDLMDGKIVLHNDSNYYVIEFSDKYLLPQGHQRSVLIKNFMADINSIRRYGIDDLVEGDDAASIYHFKKNKNNHTQSDWNAIGMRVMPNII